MNQPFQEQNMAMLTVERASALRDIVSRWKAQGLRVGFVPTMGALHQGHLSLVDLALKKAERVVVSIFVNPTQFAPHEDYDAYPREEQKDLQKLQSTGAHLVYLPGKDQIYPDAPPPSLPSPLQEGGGLRRGEAAAEGLESDFRPHFFGGVKQVVRILFEQVQPDVAVFGEKDFQQLQVIREMVETEKLPVEIRGAPIVRDEEGLALSSRNAYLSAEELKVARTLNRVLFDTAALLSSRPERSGVEGSEAQDGGSDPSTTARRRASAQDDILDKAKNELLATGFDKVDYVAARWGRILAAAWIGKTRLIDNVKI